MTTYYLAVDPGKDKCGLAVLDDKKNHYTLKNSLLGNFEDDLLTINKKYSITKIILGNGTCSKKIQQIIQKNLPTKQINIIDEKNTTYLAKQIYWQYNKPIGLQRLLPQGLRVVPQALDSYAALAIGLRWLEEN